jgi:hypothetical protein
MRKTILCLVVLSSVAFARNKHEYPLTATVVSFHAESSVGGAFSNGQGYIGESIRRVYVIKTETATLEIRGADNGFKARKRPALAIGESLNYRTDNKFIYTVLDDNKEHRFYIVSAE